LVGLQDEKQEPLTLRFLLSNVSPGGPLDLLSKVL
jgi:hypothetical protein